MFAVFGIGVAAQFWRVLPVADQWGMVAFYRAKAEHGLTFADLIAPHNEHRLPLVRVAFLVDYDCFQGTSIFATLILVLSNLALGGMIGGLATAGLNAAQRSFAMGLAMAFFVSPVQIENVILPIHMGFPLVCILAILAFACVAYAAAEQSLVWIYSLVGSAATALCPYAMANGVIAAAMAVALAWMLPVKASVRMSVTVAAFAAIATYLWGLQLPNELHATAMSAHGILDAITFFLALIGLPGASAPRIFGGVPAAVLVGIAGVTVWSAVLLRLLEAWRRRCAVDANTIALFSASTFILLTAIMITLGRAGGGPVQALSTRYGTFSLMFWASLISTTWRIMPGPGPHSRLARRGTALAATLLILLSYLAWFRVAGPSYARAAAADMVSAELRAGHFDPAHVSLVYPRPHEIRDEIEFLRRHHLSIFAQ